MQLSATRRRERKGNLHTLSGPTQVAIKPRQRRGQEPALAYEAFSRHCRRCLLPSCPEQPHGVFPAPTRVATELVCAKRRIFERGLTHFLNWLNLVGRFWSVGSEGEIWSIRQ
jgi:hypothetical protein